MSLIRISDNLKIRENLEKEFHFIQSGKNEEIYEKIRESDWPKRSSGQFVID